MPTNTPPSPYCWTPVKDGWPTEDGYYDVTTAPNDFMRLLRRSWYFENSKIPMWKKEKVVAWRKSLDNIPYEGDI